MPVGAGGCFIDRWLASEEAIMQHLLVIGTAIFTGTSIISANEPVDNLVLAKVSGGAALVLFAIACIRWLSKLPSGESFKS
jgi:hypothetical protein